MRSIRTAPCYRTRLAPPSAARSLYTALDLGLPVHRHRRAAGRRQVALADRLGARLDATMVLDETENPFLADFYGGRPGAAFQAQLFFTLARHRQQTLAAAERSLQPADDLRLPVRARQDLRVPESRRQRAVHLPAALRAAGAGRPVAGPGDLPAGARPTSCAGACASAHARTRRAASLDDAYVRELNEAYNHFFFHYTATPLLVVETSQFDLSWGDEALADLERQIRDDGQGHAVLRAANDSVGRSRSRGRTSGSRAWHSRPPRRWS